MTKSKFRAWHKTWEEMGKISWILFHDDGKADTVLFNGRDFNFKLKIDKIELMQSTGRKDKNDKEIFAGDILKVTDKFENKESWLEIVSYSEEKAMFVTKEIRNESKVPESPLYNLFDTNLFSIEVVGNIYENPELLKEK